MADPFEILGVPASFRVDEAALVVRHRDLTRLLHPDRHAAAAPAARRHALEKMIEVNDAFRILRDPARRGAYLLRAHGIELGEAGASAAGKYLPQEFLFEVMEKRETLAEARTAKNAARVSKLAAEVQAQRAEAIEAAAKAFEAGAHEEAARWIAELRSWERFLDEVRIIEDEAFEAMHG